MGVPSKTQAALHGLEAVGDVLAVAIELTASRPEVQPQRHVIREGSDTEPRFARSTHVCVFMPKSESATALMQQQARTYPGACGATRVQQGG